MDHSKADLFWLTHLILSFSLYYYSTISTDDRVIVFGSYDNTVSISGTYDNTNVAQYKDDTWTVLGKFFFIFLFFNILFF